MLVYINNDYVEQFYPKYDVIRVDGCYCVMDIDIEKCGLEINDNDVMYSYDKEIVGFKEL